jgi:osmotically-inducible protein OsmY
MKKIALAMLLCVFAMPGFAASTSTQPSSDAMKSDAYKSERPMSDRRDLSDADLTQKIRDKLAGGWFSEGYDQVTVRVYNGDVTLGGSVKTQADKEKVEKEIRNLDGVRNVNSSIAIMDRSSENRDSRFAQPQDSNRFAQDRFATPADQQLNRKIRDKVSSGIIWDSYKEITLNTNNGVVTIEGFVADFRDQQDLLDKIQKVDGVRAVRSNLSVKK